MSKKQKRLLFYCAVLVFILGSYVAILYAQGYKYDFSKAKFFKTGTFHLKVNVASDIYIDDKFAGKTSFLGTSFSEDGLLPKNYKVRAQKDNYSSWEKNITIEEGIVSDFDSVMLLPLSGQEKTDLDKEITELFESRETASSSAPIVLKNKTLYHVIEKDGETNLKKLDNGVALYKISNDENKITWLNNKNEIYVYWLKEVNYQPVHKAEDKLLLTKVGNIKSLDWFRGNQHIILKLVKGYQILEIDNRGGLNKIELN
jgi:hypothetical protein